MNCLFLRLPRAWRGNAGKRSRDRELPGLAPDALLVAVGLGAFPAFVLVHLETTLFLEIAHNSDGMLCLKMKGDYLFSRERCKAKKSVNIRAP